MNIEEYVKNICVLCVNRSNNEDLCYIRYGIDGIPSCKNEKIRCELYQNNDKIIIEGSMREVVKEADKHYGSTRYSIILPNMDDKKGEK